jgi:ATPase subunit of ABC transporter with duplicated ATPase domains
VGFGPGAEAKPEEDVPWRSCAWVIREVNREAAYARQQAMLGKEQRFIDRFAAHAAKAAQVQSRVKALEKIDKIELPKKRRNKRKK